MFISIRQWFPNIVLKIYYFKRTSDVILKIQNEIEHKEVSSPDNLNKQSNTSSFFGEHRLESGTVAVFKEWRASWWLGALYHAPFKDPCLILSYPARTSAKCKLDLLTLSSLAPTCPSACSILSTFCATFWIIADDLNFTSFLTQVSSTV